MSLEVKEEAVAAGTALADGIHHVAVQTSDLDNSTRWYRDYFGCEVSWTLEKFSPLTAGRLPGISKLVELAVGGVRFHVFTLGPDGPPVTPAEANQFQHVCLPARTPEELVYWREKWLRLFDSGEYTFARPEPVTEIVVDADGMRSLYLYDVNGLEYEFSYFPDGPHGHSG
jgi:catechol 2,3-dioxygenase-like lactoylglutathione lyase family enzyme